jgi:hypothetical protein
MTASSSNFFAWGLFFVSRFNRFMPASAVRSLIIFGATLAILTVAQSRNALALSTGCAAVNIGSRRQRLVDSPGPGFVRLTVMDATGVADTVVVRIQ